MPTLVSTAVSPVAAPKTSPRPPVAAPAGLVFACLALLLVATPAWATEVLINNGLGPPNAENVLSGPLHARTDFFIHNANCPEGEDWTALCPEPWGDPSTVEVTRNTTVQSANVYETSSLELTGGWVSGGVTLFDEATLFVVGGDVGNPSQEPPSGVVAFGVSVISVEDGEAGIIELCDDADISVTGGVLTSVLPNSASIVVGGCFTPDIPRFGLSVADVSGGLVEGDIWVRNFGEAWVTGGEVEDLRVWGKKSSILIWTGGTARASLSAERKGKMFVVGTDFAVDGVPVDYGKLEAQSGALTGTLLDGSPVDNFFFHAGFTLGDFVANGSIILTDQYPVPEPTTAALHAAAIAVLGAIARRRRRAGLRPSGSPPG